MPATVTVEPVNVARPVARDKEEFRFVSPATDTDSPRFESEVTDMDRPLTCEVIDSSDPMVPLPETLTADPSAVSQ